MSTLQAWCCLCLRPQGLLVKKCVQGSQQKLHSQASRRAETLGPSSAKDSLIFSPVPCAQKDLATPYLSSAFPATFFSSSLYLPFNPPTSAHFISSSSSLGCLWAD